MIGRIQVAEKFAERLINLPPHHTRRVAQRSLRLRRWLYSRSIDNHILTLRLKSENNPEQSEPRSNSASSGYKFTF
jgi:hypothetical protein